VKETFVRVSEKYGLPYFADLVITASNDINEETILSLNEQVRQQRHLSAVFVLKRRYAVHQQYGIIHFILPNSKQTETSVNYCR
jgi:hypothetical protein